MFDIASGEFRCTFCFNIVEEDVSSVPKQDTRAMMIKYNNEMDVLFKLLGEAEGLKLSPELLEPDPIDIADILGYVYTYTVIYDFILSLVLFLFFFLQK